MAIKNCLFLLCLAVFVFSCAAGAAGAGSVSSVRLYNWSDYIGDSSLSDFQSQTGINPIYDVYDSNETLEAKLLTGHAGYDVVFPSSHFLPRHIQAGALSRIDKDKLGNYSNLDSSILAMMERVDPGNIYAVPYLWGTSGIAYNEDMVEAVLGEGAITSWGVLFEPDIVRKLSQCGVALMDSPDEVYGAVVHYLSDDGDDIKSELVERATSTLRRVRPYITYFHSSKFVNDLANGDICIAMANSGDAYQAMKGAMDAKNGVRIGYSIPKEGGNVWVDVMAIPADAPDKEAAHAFINFMLASENIAKVTESTGYANPNSGAGQYLSDAILSNTTVYPNRAMRERLYISRQTPPDLMRMITRSWQAVKYGY